MAAIAQDSVNGSYHSKPCRSDAYSSPEEIAANQANAKAFLDSLTPNRPDKPCRSETEDGTTRDFHVPDSIPELNVLKKMNEEDHTLPLETSQVIEDHTTTQYYDNIYVGPEHVTIGTGFIPMKNVQAAPILTSDCHTACASTCTSNPATNEWSPSASQVELVSSKPARSDL